MPHPPLANRPKRPPRRTPEAAAFHREMSLLKPFLSGHYAEMATRIFPGLDPQLLRYAVAGRRVYKEALPALRMVAGLDPVPSGLFLTADPPTGAAG